MARKDASAKKTISLQKCPGCESMIRPDAPIYRCSICGLSSGIRYEIQPDGSERTKGFLWTGFTEDTPVVLVNYEGVTASFEIRDPDEHMQKHWVAGSFYEVSNRKRTGLLNYIYSQKQYFGGACVDIGASIGNHTVFFAKVMDMNMLAIEPYRPSFDHLDKNIGLNNLRGVTCIRCAVGDSDDKQVTMSGNGKISMMRATVDADGDVPMRTLDRLVGIANRSRLDFIKIDVEGFNAFVIAGMQETLSRFRPDVYMECGSDDELEEADHLMCEVGYGRQQGLVFNSTPTYLWKALAID